MQMILSTYMASRHMRFNKRHTHSLAGQGQLPTSPAKSLSSGEGTAPEAASGTEVSDDDDDKLMCRLHHQ